MERGRFVRSGAVVAIAMAVLTPATALAVNFGMAMGRRPDALTPTQPRVDAPTLQSSTTAPATRPRGPSNAGRARRRIRSALPSFAQTRRQELQQHGQ